MLSDVGSKQKEEKVAVETTNDTKKTDTKKVGTEDAEFLVKEFSPVFNAYDMINIDKGTAYVKLLVDNSSTRPFSMKTIWPLLGIRREEMSKKIRTLSRLKYGQDRSIVEAEIIRRTEARTSIIDMAKNLK
jgi:hypothetical protein